MQLNLQRESFAQEGLYSRNVGLGVDAYGVEINGFDVQGEAVFEQAQLLEAFGLFQRTGFEGSEAQEGRAAVGVEAQVLPVGGFTVGEVAGEIGVPIVGDGGPAEVERAAVGGVDDLYGVGVGDVFGCADGFDGGAFDLGTAGEGAEERVNVLGLQERFVSLDVDVDVCLALEGDGAHAVGAAGQIGVGHLTEPAVDFAEVGDLLAVGGDDDSVELRAAEGSLNDPLQHGATEEWAQHFTGQAGGGEAGGNDSEGDWHAFSGPAVWSAGRLPVNYMECLAAPAADRRYSPTPMAV